MTTEQRKLYVYHQYRILADKVEEMYHELKPGQLTTLEDCLKAAWLAVDRRVGGR